MSDLAQGTFANVVLKAGESVRVGTNGQATVASEYGAPAGTTTLNATSQVFGPYQVPAKLRVTAVSGTASYAQPAQVPVTVDQSSGTVNPSGAVPVPGMSALTNAAALKPFAETLLSAAISEVYVTGTGNSLFQFGGDNPAAPPSSDTLAEKNGFLAQFRFWLNTYFGTPDGGQWIPAQAAVSDTRVANTGTSNSGLAQFGPYNAYNNGSGQITSRTPVSLQVGGDKVTWTVFGRYLDVEVWENTSNGFNGSCNWTVDGAGGGVLNSNGGGGANDTYRTIRLDLGTDGNHVVDVVWAAGKVLLTGATVTRGKGVVTRRFGYGGSKASNWATLASKQIRTSFQTLVTHLHIIRLSYNDWNNQVADATTITTFKASIQTLIDAAFVNTNVKAVLLIADPPASTADTNPILIRAFSNALRDLALVNTRVAFYDVDLVVNGTFAAGNTAGMYVDFVHRSGGPNGGYGMEARPLAQALYSMSKVGS